MSRVQDFFTIIWSIFLNITISDVIDIVVVAYLILKLLTVVRKTTTSSVIKGIVFLVALIWVSSLLELTMVTFILGETMKLGLLVIIVLFQPELRKFLEQFGSRNWSLIFKPKVQNAHIETSIAYTISACFEMSKTKTGALIVFEREIGLGDYIRTGTRVDAVMSVELLGNIFFHNSPLHDGAVIVNGGRIVSAGCMLPMSNNANLSRELGMRHRAGIGISERSDAIAVIVSEETGSVSVAIDGMLKRHLARDTFEKLLRNELISESEPRESRFRRRRKTEEKK